MAEKLEQLGKGICQVVTNDHGFGTDALLLADFASPKKNDRCMDFGTGCGIIPMVWKRNGVTADIYGLDIQPKAIEQFNESVKLSSDNGHDMTNVHPILFDLKKIADGDKTYADLHGSFRVVTMNPPYKPSGEGIISDSGADKIARHMTECDLDDICKAAAKLLNFGGRFCVCLRPERLPDMMEAMRSNGLEPKRLRFVAKRPGSKPWLFLLEGRRGGRPFLEVDGTLYIQAEDGSQSEELKRIIGEYAD